MFRITHSLEVLFSLLVLFVFVNRYIIGSILRLLDKRSELIEHDPTEWPSVAIVIPVFNEGVHIVRTAETIALLDYPPARLSVLFVDDCSEDDTPQQLDMVARHYPWMRVARNRHNLGKRLSIKWATRACDADLVLSIDSDVLVEPDTLKQLVRHMLATQVDAVGGCVYVSNPNENWLTRMQAVKYWVGYQLIKNIENTFDHVMCLSGCLTLYRRTALLAVEHELEDRRFLGEEIKYGEDRYLTRKLVEYGFKTRLTFKARCFTKAPASIAGYLNQQLRWRRSNIIDFLTAIAHIDRFHPIVCLNYSMVALLLLFYPVFLISEIMTLGFMLPMLLHALTATVFGTLFELSKHRLPESARTSGLWFLSMALVFPVMYLTLTPLALATLATTSWETRGKGRAVSRTAHHSVDSTRWRTSARRCPPSHILPRPAARTVSGASSAALPRSTLHVGTSTPTNVFGRSGKANGAVNPILLRAFRLALSSNRIDPTSRADSRGKNAVGRTGLDLDDPTCNFEPVLGLQARRRNRSARAVGCVFQFCAGPGVLPGLRELGRSGDSLARQRAGGPHRANGRRDDGKAQ